MRTLRLIATALALFLAASGAHAGKFLKGARAGGGGCSTAATPAPALTGSPTLLASWDFGDTSKITLASGKISQITGSDSTAYTLAQGTTSAQPVPLTAGCFQAAQFTNAQSLKLATSFGLAASGTISVVAVAEMAEPALNGTLFSFSSSNSNTSSYGRHKLVANGTYLGFGMRVGDNSTNQLASEGSSVVGVAYPRGRHLVVGAGAPNAGTIAIYQDAAATTGTIASQFSSVSGGYVVAMLGADQVADFLDGLVWRVLIYQGTLTSTNVTELAAWANSNWGIGNAGATITQADLTWNVSDTTGLTGWKAYWSKTLGGTDNSAAISGAATQSYSVTGLTSGTWYFMVRSVNANGEGDNIYMGSKAIQ